MDEAFFGTETKWLINITSPGFDMDRDDFELVLKTGSKRVSIKKQDCFKDEEDRWYFTFDTSLLKAGVVEIVTTAYVPDDDFPDGIRTEVDKKSLITTKKV